MTFFKFNTHPAPGFHADGSFVVQDTKSSISLATKTEGKKKVAADYGGASGTGTGMGSGTYGNPGMSGISFEGGGSASTVDTYNPIRDRLEEGSIIEDWIPRDASGIDEMYKLMYNRDYIAGVIVDLLAEMVWSEFDLVGISDPVILNTYRDSMEAIDIVTVGPEIAKEFMVIGRTVSSMIFNKERGVFDDIICHDPSFLRLTPIPIKGFDPKIDLIPSPALRMFVDSLDPRDVDARKVLPQSYVDAVRKASGGSNKSGYSPNQSFIGQGSGGSMNTSGGIPLDPINTLFLPRRTFGWDHIGTSMFTRLITFWALEKALINATMSSARRRIRSILHVKAGIDNVWEPSSQEMDNIAGMFIQADEDPAGAVVVTRTGVDTNEVRSGTDFYKWADEWQLLNEGKLRALGANDALLCLSGDTLIPTAEYGIIRIDTFGKGSEEKVTTVGSAGFDTTKKWLYSGTGKVLEFKTNSGNSIKCTPDHQILVLVNNELVWKKAKDLKLDDYLCISKEKCTRQNKLSLGLITPEKLKMAHGLNENIIKPEVMTTDLAYVIGMLVSEGCIDNYRIRVSNTDLSILEAVKDKILNTFGTEISVTINKRNASDRIDKHGVFWKSNKQAYELCCWSKTIADYCNQLGICVSNGIISKDKVVPWSILQADEESQLSYLAAYVDGDGSVKRNGKELVIYSYSNEILRQTQIMLNSHGIDSMIRRISLRATCGNSYELCKKLAKYSYSPKFKNILEPTNLDRGYGIITTGIRKLIKERFVRKVQNVGFVFLNDDNQETTVRKFGKRNITRWKHLLYSSYASEEYNDFLNFLKEISLKEHSKIIDLFSRKFKFTQVKEIKYLDEELDVFDIKMVNNPSFVANGIVVHNSGDATYSNQEAARAFFMERVVRLREVLTTRIFYNRLFPLTARIHGFKKRTTAELANRIRIESSESHDGNKNITQRQALSIPNNQLIIPKISWHKELVNKINTAKIEIYEKLEEKGVPIKLRDWSAAGGVDLDSQVSGLESDADLRKQVAKWKSSFESTESESQEEEAKLEFIRSLKNLAQSNLRTALGSNIVNLGPLASFVFWDANAHVGPVSAKDLSEFLTSINPDDASYRIVGDAMILKHRLFTFFKNTVKAEIAHYLIYRSGLTPIKPALSTDALVEVSSCIKSSLDQYANHGQIYKLAKLAEGELSILGQLSAKRFDTASKHIDEKSETVNSAVKKHAVKDRNLLDKIQGVNLYSGV